MKQLLISSCIGFIIFFSCKKSDTEPPPPPPPATSAIDSLNGWQKITTNLTTSFIDIAFNSPATGVLATEAGVYKSMDSGKTWLKETSITGMPVTINYFNQQYGYAVGQSSMQITSNAGTNWRTKNSTVDATSTEVFFINPATGYIAHPSGPVYKTKDTGQTWQRIGFASNGNCLSIFFLNDQQGWYSSGTHLFRTIDGGSTWTNQKVTNDMIITVYFRNLTDGWLTADSSVYRTTNGGTSWSKSSFGSAAFDLQFLNAQTGYVSTEKGIWKTIDGGATWKQNLYAPLPYFPELIFLDESTGWVTGQNGIVYRWKK